MATSKRRPGAARRPRVRATANGSRKPEARGPKAAARSARSRAPPRTAYAVAEIVARLHLHRQRATYAAVGGLRGAPAVRVRGWFAGREAPENSFVVSRMTGEPIGYPADRVDPALKERGDVIESAEALRAWLGAHPPPGRGAEDG